MDNFITAIKQYTNTLDVKDLSKHIGKKYIKNPGAVNPRY